MVRTPPSDLIKRALLVGALVSGVVGTGAAQEGKRIGPAYGNGRVWVRPLPMTPRELAALLTGKSAGELHDSVVSGWTQKYLDAIAADRAASDKITLPSWTTTVGGKTVGIDPQFIYLGPLKVPTFLLALLPINMMQDPGRIDRARKVGLMREDMMYAAQRAINFAQFKAAVMKLRQEKEADREFARNQRRLPPPIPSDST